MNIGYIVRRIGVFLIIIWLAATINFARVICAQYPAKPLLNNQF